MADATWTATDVAAGDVPTIENGTLGEAVTAGQAIFLDATDSLIYKADASTGSAGEKPDSGDTIGVALSGGSAGQTVAYAKRAGDKITYSAATFTAGQWYVVSAIAGGLMPTADLASTNYSVGIGWAESATVLVLLTKRTGTQLA